MEDGCTAPSSYGSISMRPRAISSLIERSERIIGAKSTSGRPGTSRGWRPSSGRLEGSVFEGVGDPFEAAPGIPPHGGALLAEADERRAVAVHREQMRRSGPGGIGPVVRDLEGPAVDLEFSTRCLGH